MISERGNVNAETRMNKNVCVFVFRYKWCGNGEIGFHGIDGGALT